MLIIFSGLPGVGKSAVARALAREIGAVWLRIDSIETAIAPPGIDVDDRGYRAAYAIAADNLRLGHFVAADSVNPLNLTRAAWRDVGRAASVGSLDVELACSDAAEHRRRVEHRVPDIAGFQPPTWREVMEREYEPWSSERLTIDTARISVADAIGRIRAALPRA